MCVGFSGPTPRSAVAESCGNCLTFSGGCPVEVPPANVRGSSFSLSAAELVSVFITVAKHTHTRISSGFSSPFV